MYEIYGYGSGEIDQLGMYLSINLYSFINLKYLFYLHYTL